MTEPKASLAGSPVSPDSAAPSSGSTLSRREALWRSAALAAGGLLTTRVAWAQTVDTSTPPLDVVVDPIGSPTPVDVSTGAGADAGTDPVVDWTVDPAEAPVDALEAAYFEGARADEAAELAAADALHSEVLEAAALESLSGLEAVRTDQAQETEEHTLELALVTAGAAGQAAQVADLTAKLRQVRDTYRLRQEQQVKRRMADRHSENESKAVSRQRRRREESARKVESDRRLDAMLVGLRQLPDRQAQESSRKQKSQQRQVKRRISESQHKAQLSVRVDRQASGTQQQAEAQAQQALLLQRGKRIRQESDAKKAPAR